MKKSRLFNSIHPLLLVALYSITLGVSYLAYFSEPAAKDGFMTMRWVVFLLLFPILAKFIIQLFTISVYSFSERSREKRHKLNGDESVSVLIPAWNEEVGIIKTINSVLASDYENLEVIVINDGSTDSTDELITRYLHEYEQLDHSKKTLKYISKENGGKARALNEALKICTGEFVVTIDADCLIDKDAITNTLRRFGSKKVGAVGGNIIVGNKKKTIELVQQLEYLYGFFFKRADSVFNSVYIIGGAAAAYRKSVLDEVGGFDESVVTEDIEMSMRILSHGYKTRYAYDAITYTEGPSRWKCFFNQRLRWRFGRFQTFIKHRHLFFSGDSTHNRYFTFLLLPIALYAEFTLFFQVFFLALFYTYTFVTQDYMPLVFMIVFMATMVCLQILFDSKSHFHLNLLLLAPIAWLVFYIVDFVELQALFRSLKRLVKQEDLAWQKWARVGLAGNGQETTAPSPPSDELSEEPFIRRDGRFFIYQLLNMKKHKENNNV